MGPVLSRVVYMVVANIGAAIVALSRIPQQETPGEWAKLCWDVLAGQGQRIMKDGKALETPAENIAELTTQAQTFADKQLPALKALGVG